MRQLGSRQREILSLMGVTIWQHKAGLSFSAASSDGAVCKPLYGSVTQSGETKTLVVIEPANPDAGCSAAERKFLGNILFAIGIGLDHVSVVESGRKLREQDGALILQDAVRELNPSRVIVFGGEAGALLDRDGQTRDQIVLPGLINMMRKPTLKKTCWNKLIDAGYNSR